MSGATPFLLQRVGDDVFVKKSEALLYVLPLLMVAAVVVRSIAEWIATVAESSVGTRIVAEIRIRMFDTIASADLAWIQGVHSGRFVSTVVSDSGAVDRAANRVLVGIFKNGASIVFLMGAMFYMDWRLSLIVLIGAPPRDLQSRTAAEEDTQGRRPHAAPAGRSEQRADPDPASHARGQGLRPGGKRGGAPAPGRVQPAQILHEGHPHAGGRRPVLGDSRRPRLCRGRVLLRLPGGLWPGDAGPVHGLHDRRVAELPADEVARRHRRDAERRPDRGGARLRADRLHLACHREARRPAAQGHRRRHHLQGRRLRLRAERPGSFRLQSGAARRTQACPCRAERRGQEHGAQSHPAPLRSEGRSDRDRRTGPARRDDRKRPCRLRAPDPGSGDLRRYGRRQYLLRLAGRERGGDHRRGEGGRGARFHHEAALRVRDARRGIRQPALRRRAPAHRLRARHAPRYADRAPRRADQRARRGIRKPRFRRPCSGCCKGGRW